MPTSWPRRSGEGTAPTMPRAKYPPPDVEPRPGPPWVIADPPFGCIACDEYWRSRPLLMSDVRDTVIHEGPASGTRYLEGWLRNHHEANHPTRDDYERARARAGIRKALKDRRQRHG